MTSLRTLFAILSAISLLYAPDIYSNEVFRDQQSGLSFRYPDGWEQKEPQLESTIVLLYATDKSQATCNVSNKIIKDIDKLTEVQLNKLRALNHTQAFFNKNYSKMFDNYNLVSYRRGRYGQKDAGIAEIQHDLYINNSAIKVTQVIGATLATGRRFVLTCNAPLDHEKSAKDAFTYISNTTLFVK